MPSHVGHFMFLIDLGTCIRFAASYLQSRDYNHLFQLKSGCILEMLQILKFRAEKSVNE